MHHELTWVSVTSARPCPVCERKKYCRVAEKASSGGRTIVWCSKLEGAPGQNGFVLAPRPDGWQPKKSGKPWTQYIPAAEVDLWKGGGDAGAAGDGGDWKPLTPEQKAAKEREREAARRKKIEGALKLWDAARGSVDHPAARAYFAARGIPLDALPGRKLPPTIRYLELAKYTIQRGENDWVPLRRGPVILCAAQDADNAIVALQRIYLDVNGAPKKRAVEDCRIENPEPGADGADRWIVDDCKKTVGPVGGAAVRLFGEFPDGDLLISEGIETGLALLAATGRATWAAVSCGNARVVTLPEKLDGVVKRVALCLDHDSVDRLKDGTYKGRPGRVNANLAAGAWRERGLNAVVVIPGPLDAPELIGPAPGTEDEEGDVLRGKSVDWLDVLNVGGVERVKEGVERKLAGERGEGAGGSEEKTISDLKSQSSEGDGGGGEGAGMGGSGGGDDLPELILPSGDLPRAQLALEGLWAPEESARAGGRWTVAHFVAKQQWLEYVGTHYRMVRSELVRSRLAHFFTPFWSLTSAGAKKEPEDWKRRDFRKANLSAAACQKVMDMMIAECAIFGDDLPAWGAATFGSIAPHRPRWGAEVYAYGSEEETGRGVVAFQNGLLSVDRLLEGEVKLLPHSPRYVALSCAPFRLDVAALTAEIKRDPECKDHGEALAKKLCPRFAAFLEDRFPNDRVSKWVLLSFLGLCFTTDTSFEQALFLIGPPGSGKGTTVDIFTAVLGEDAVAATSFKELTERFELGKLVGKHVALMDEARIGHTTDSVEAGRRLNSMIGGAPASADVKFGEKTEFVRPKCKFLLTANELPRIMDPSAAMVRRLLVLPFPERNGPPDRALKPALKAEAAGIAAWALVALRDLYRVGKFVPSSDGSEMMEDFQRLSSPVYAFCKDVCVFEPNSTVRTALLYDLFIAWAESEGLKPIPMERFGVQLRAVNANVVKKTLSIGHSRVKAYAGVRPKVLDDFDRSGENVVLKQGKDLPPVDVDDDRHMAELDFEWEAGRWKYQGMLPA